MSYAQSPKRTGLPREVVKWLQNLNLPFYPMNVRRDFSNGYLVAEIFSRYYPHFPMHSFDNGTSLSAKQRNWSQIEKSLQKINLRLMREVIDGTIHCKPGAAEQLVQTVYTILTNRRDAQGPESGCTDQEHQPILPTLANSYSTASKANKINPRITQNTAEPGVNTNQRKAEVILHQHPEHKVVRRLLYPGCFKAKPTLGRPAAKNPVVSSCRDEDFDSPSSVLMSNFPKFKFFHVT
uniref:Spermatogenesis-associated protein 4 n=1 Tax=Mola mola TaxID=94237 RepID=A0A3Q3W112_MOLML